MPDNEKYIGLLPVTDTITATDTLVGVIDDKAQQIEYGDLFQNIQLPWSNIENKPFNVVDTDYFQTITTVPYGVTLTFSNDVLTALDTLEDITPLMDELGDKAGYDLEINDQTNEPEWVYNGKAETNLNLKNWVFSMMTNYAGAAPTSSGSGSGTTWSWAYDSATAMGSTYTQDLKRYNFDNNWTSGRSYQVGAVVVHEGTILQCRTANSDVTFDVSHWNTIGGGGGGGGADDSNKFMDMFKYVMTGFRKALDPNYYWMLDGNLFYNSLTNTEKAAIKTTAEDGYQDTYPYGFARTDTYDMDKTGWYSPDWNFDDTNVYAHTGVHISNGGVWGNSRAIYKSDEQMLNSDTLKIRCSILEMLTRMFSAYIDFSKYVRNAQTTLPGYSEWDNNNNQWVATDQITPDEDRGDYDNGILNYMPFVVNSINVTDATESNGFDYKYNPFSDLCAKIMEMTTPKVVTGIFRYDNWIDVDEEEYGERKTHWKQCKLTDISNPSNATCVNKDAISRSNIIMDVRLPSLNISDGSGGYTDQNTLRAQIIKEYNKIMDTNLSTWTTNNQMYVNQWEQTETDYTHSGGMLTDDIFSGTYQNDDWKAVTAYISDEEDTPTVDIPVTFLVFPNNYSYGKMFEYKET